MHADKSAPVKPRSIEVVRILLGSRALFSRQPSCFVVPSPSPVLADAARVRLTIAGWILRVICLEFGGHRGLRTSACAILLPCSLSDRVPYRRARRYQKADVIVKIRRIIFPA